MVYIIASLAMKRVNALKEQINCTFSTLQNMVHLVRTAFGDPDNTYGGDVWSIPPFLSPPFYKNLEAGYGAVVKCSISRDSLHILGY